MIVSGEIEINGIVKSFEWFYPSIIVKEYLEEKSYGPEFINLAIKALIDANKRVVDKYGFECSGCVQLLHKLRVLSKQPINKVIVKKIINLSGK